jgi:dTDP-glucose 4,6-dehydratase
VRRAVITGGAGFLGSHLCGELLNGGYEVICVDNLQTGARSNIAQFANRNRFNFICADVTQDLAVPGPVDLVLHLASAASPADYLRLPIQTLTVGSHGTRNALELARRKNSRFVLASTSEVYGDPKEHPQQESYWGNVNPVGPRSVYDEAKRYAEALTTAYRNTHRVNTGIVRIFNSYGPRLRPDDGRAIPTFVRQALLGDAIPVTGDGGQTRSICYVDDTIRGIIALAASAHPGPVNIGSPDEISMRALAGLIRDLSGSRSPIEFTERPVDDPAVRCPDITLARTVLGWEPLISMEDGLRRTIRWFEGELGRPSRRRASSG